jgi:uncharacterized Zn finger protein (UPF0148 family)
MTADKAEQMPKKTQKWCPECGDTKYHNLHGGERICVACGQSWFTDVEYGLNRPCKEPATSNKISGDNK